MKQQSSSQQSPQGRPATRRRPQSLRLLVVENHPDMREGLKVFLKLLGHEARFEESVADALQAGGEEDFDLLLSDISLPDGDGWDLLRKLNAAGRRPPHAVAMSGFGSSADLAASQEVGFDKHLVKPFPPEELEAVLRQASAKRPTPSK